MPFAPALRLASPARLIALGLLAGQLTAQSLDVPAGPKASPPNLAAIGREVRADMSFLADDQLHGRGSATRDEHIAALFAAAQLQALGLDPGGDNGTFLQKTALPALTPEQQQRFDKRIAKYEDTPRKETWNAIGILRGASRPGEVVLLTAHLDHLGIGKPEPAAPAADLIYNGADDDASGVTAVLALVHQLATGPRPARTVVVALFGTEELGGLGDRAFLDRPPVPLTAILANLEFEMVGRPDPAVPPANLWLTGYGRSNLGPELAAHGARLVADPHPKEDFFERSDNYALARRGIVAHTVSSYGLHKDYHRVTDELAGIDFDHLTAAVVSMLVPIEWLANSDFKPVWNPNGRP